MTAALPQEAGRHALVSGVYRPGRISLLGLLRALSVRNPQHDYLALRARAIVARRAKGYDITHEIVNEDRLRAYLVQRRHAEPGRHARPEGTST